MTMDLSLELALHKIDDLDMGTPSRLEGGRLWVDPDEVQALLPPEAPVRLERVAVALPGHRIRLAPVLDIVEPRAKDDAEASAFPGFTGLPHGAGEGRSHLLDGVAVLAVADLTGAQEGLVDMSPEAADYCPFARTKNLVLHCSALPGADRVAADEAIRMLTLEVAERLAGLGRGRQPDRVQVWQCPAAGAGLPRVALVYLVQSQGDLRRTFLYGYPADAILPTIIDPLEVLDGAVVSGNFVMPSNKTCTYIHQNNPLLRELLARHNKDLDFAGVVVANEMSRMADKERAAGMATRLVQALGAQGALINQEGGGNTVTDVMMICRQLSRSGIKTVLLLNEFAGADGTTPSLTETTPEATAVVSTGNNDHRLVLPPVKEVIGLTSIPGVEGNLEGEISLPLGRLHSSTNQLGFNNLSCLSL